MPAHRTLERLVWIVLGFTVAGVFIAFFLDNRKGPPPPVFYSIPDFSLTNQNGHAFTSSDLKGKVWIADIIFTRCPSLCIGMSKEMHQFESELDGDSSLAFVSLTADPENDTPPILKDYAKKFGADDRWTFLTGSRSNINYTAMEGLKLAVQEVDPKERNSLNDLFIHSPNFVLIDRQGKIRGWYDSTDSKSHGELLRATRRLLKEKP